MIELTLDGAQNMEYIHDMVAQTLQFPAHYGRTLDALYDCLTEVREDVEFHLVNLNGFGRRGPALQLLLQKAAMINPHIRFHIG